MEREDPASVGGRVEDVANTPLLVERLVHDLVRDADGRVQILVVP